MAIKVNTKKKAKKQRRSRRTKSVDDVGFIGKALRGLGGLGGTTIGTMLGNPAAGSALGHSLGAAVSKWLGAGDYEISSNSVVSKAASAIPSMHKTNQSVIVRHKEYLGTISGSTTFQVARTFPINPGLPESFPWLSDIARNFQEYQIKGMVYHYVPTSGNAVSSTNAALGAVMIQTTYRTTDLQPQSKVEMMNEYCSNEVVPSECMAHPIECDPKENPFSIHYVRSTSIVSGEPMMYDIGKTFVATQGMQSSNVVGDLWVTYEIEFKKPLLYSSVVPQVQFYSQSFDLPSVGSFFKGTPGPVVGNLAIKPDSVDGRKFYFPVGSYGLYLVTGHIKGNGNLTSSTTTAWVGSVTTSNCTTWPGGIDGGTAEATGTSCATSGSDLYYRVVIGVENPSSIASVTFPSASWTGGTAGIASLEVVSLGPITTLSL